MDKCQKSFNNLKELLTKYPILQYPDPSKDYTLFIDASIFRYAGVLTQEYEDNSINKEASCLHAELFFVLVLMWLPQQHMVSIWTPHGIHVETLWCPVETT